MKYDSGIFFMLLFSTLFISILINYITDSIVGVLIQGIPLCYTLFGERKEKVNY